MSVAISGARSRSQGAGPRGLAQGGFFNFIKKAVGIIPGVGPVASAALGFIGGRGGQAQQRALPPGAPRLFDNLGRPTAAGLAAGNARFQATDVVRSPGFRGAVERFLPGGRTGLEVVGGGEVGTSLACPSGFHPNKSDYYTQEGFVPEGTRCVKNRTRNFMNPRAINAAVTRISGAKRGQEVLKRITIRKKC